jgi:hypothetical protein
MVLLLMQNQLMTREPLVWEQSLVDRLMVRKKKRKYAVNRLAFPVDRMLSRSSLFASHFQLFIQFVLCFLPPAEVRKAAGRQFSWRILPWNGREPDFGHK